MNKSLAQSRWRRIIPVVFITYSLAYLDRANIGFGVAGGMAEDLHITAAISSLLGSLFFLGYFFFQIPGVYYAAKKSARTLIFWSLIFWGMFAMATGLISNIKISSPHPLHARRSGKCRIPFHAAPIEPLVYQDGTFQSQYLPYFRKPCHHTLDVCPFWIFDKCTGLEMDVYPGKEFPP